MSVFASSSQDGKRRRLVRRCSSATEKIEAMTATPLPAQWLKDGSLLERLAVQHMTNMSSIGGNICPHNVLEWGSLCSGSEGPAWVFSALNVVFAKNKVGLRFKHVFSCEIHKQKQVFIKKVIDHHTPASQTDAPCLYSDICCMSGTTAPCVAHDQECKLRLA